jgi:hypothetical protein
MLHSASPTNHVPSDRLAKPPCAPSVVPKPPCRVVIHLGDFEYDSEVREGLIWTCSDRGFLSWEHPRYVATY